MSDIGKNIVLWLIILAVLLTVFNNFEVEPKQQPMAYSEFIDAVERGEVREATIQDNKITATDGSGETFSVTGFQYDPRLVQILDENRVRIDVKPPETQSIFTQILVASFPILIILAVAIFFMRQMQGGSGGRGGPMAFGRSKAKLLSEDQIKTTFADVAGVDSKVKWPHTVGIWSIRAHLLNLNEVPEPQCVSVLGSTVEADGVVQ